MKNDRDGNPQAYLPLKPDVFLILTILARGEQYGYAIMQAAEAFSDGHTRIQAGALYRRLKWMLDEGLIRDQGDRLSQGERRRYYGITSFGREVAAAEARRMDAFLVQAKAASLLHDPEPARGS